MKTVAYIMGGTCSGKSTFLQYAKSKLGGAVGLIEVGKMLRAKYDPSYFLGQAAPAHTQQEAWELFAEALEVFLRDDHTQLVLVDGQPRDIPQVHGILAHFAPRKGVVSRFCYMHCRREEQEHRAAVRHNMLGPGTASPEDVARYDLAMDRVDNDRRSYCDVLAILAKAEVPVQVWDTSGPAEFYQNEVLESLLKPIPAPRVPRTYLGKIHRVLDGDTLDVVLDLGFHVSRLERLRLVGVNTPEIKGLHRDDGIAAKSFLASLLPEGTLVRVSTNKTDKYGRYVANIWRDGDGKDICAELLNSGHADEYDGKAKVA